jgi:hypothetical protein
MTSAFYFDGPKAQAIIEALGLPAATHQVILTMTRGEFVQITLTYAPPDLDALPPLLRTMKFVPLVSRAPGEFAQTDQEQEQPRDRKDPTYRRAVTWIALHYAAALERCIRSHQARLQGMVDPLPDSDQEEAQARKECGDLEEFIDWRRYQRDARRRTKEGQGVPPVFYLKPGFQLHASVRSV